ncbi:MAG: phenylacetate--CoA ligase, partial [Pseudomonadota bacterium]
GREGPLDTLAVIVEARHDAGDEISRAAAGQTAERHIKQRIGITARVNVLAPDGVERSMGKAKRIVDLRPKD